jgi:hypothetical protein
VRYPCPRFCAGPVSGVRVRRRRRVLLQEPGDLSLVRRAADGGHGGASRGPGVPAGAGAPVGAERAAGGAVPADPGRPASVEGGGDIPGGGVPGPEAPREGPVPGGGLPGGGDGGAAVRGVSQRQSAPA